MCRVYVTPGVGQTFKFAARNQLATLKVEARRLLNNPTVRGRLLDICGVHPCVVTADALAPVPNGMSEFTDELGELFHKPVIRMTRPNRERRNDIRFVAPTDEALAKSVLSVCELEDVSRTGFSAYATGKRLREVNPNLEVHSLSVLQRNIVEEQYQKGPEAITYHTLAHQTLPLDIATFRQQFPDIPVDDVSE
jgi:hypothetical protein